MLTTLGSRKYFLPESPSLQMIVCCTRRFRGYSMMFSRDFVPSLLQFPSIDKVLCITTYTCHSYNHFLLILLLQDTPKFSLLFRESFMLTTLQFLPQEYPYDNSSHLPSIRSSPVFHVFHKGLRNTIRSPENPQPPIALEILTRLQFD